MTLAEIESQLRKDLKVQSVSEIKGLPFKDYEEILALHKQGELRTGTRMNENVVDLFGSQGQRILDKVLLSSPILAIIASIVLAIVRSDYVLLWGIASAILALILTANAIMKSGKGVGGLILIATLAAFIYFWIKGDFVKTFLFGAYWVPNFLLTVSKEQNRLVMTDAVMSSELVFIYYYLRGEFAISRKGMS
ncbi:MAG: hypothetical protein H6594_11435 [Flavobacteriales bacterium]|nr:hypothetical protein [Flavobacteriales bacterium]